MLDAPYPWLNDTRWRVALIAGGILSLALLHWLVPVTEVHIHNFLQHLNFLPIVLAGLFFGWRGAAVSTLASAVLQFPHLWRTWESLPVYVSDMLLELPVFGLGGVVIGMLAERERGQRLKLEKTKQQLETVYQKLQDNIERLKRTERLSAAGQLSAGLAHEIRNPLASISGAAGILKRGHASGENRRECLEIIEKETQRLNRLLGSFLDFARPRAPRFQPVDLVALLDSVAGLAQHAAITTSVEIRQEIHEPLPEVRCDPEQLKQVLLNLIINAIQATDGPGTVCLQAGAGDGNVAILVRDEGCGIPEADRERIFDPFFTTKENGTGLGLAVAAKIIEQHGGVLAAEANPKRGMTFRVELSVNPACLP
ncbi:MAG: sensor histidine kinase [Acidobacteria bacterium]|nr:sensor histidine kinase [Acidobacteriota bacterium]